MTFVHFDFHLANEDTELGIEMVVDGKPAAHVVLGPAEVEKLIEDLGRHRSLLADQIPSAPDLSLPAVEVNEPNFVVHEKANVVGLALGHPYYGWLHFSFQKRRALELSEALRDLSAIVSRKKH